MTQELHYTSLPRGLKPGSRGFCTVASTPRMTGPLAERLESLSGYVPVYPVHDAAASRNPINFMHLKVATGGKSVSVLSRVGPAGLDYSGRTNMYGHHVVLDASERPLGGPAWALSQPGFLKERWEGEPRELPEGAAPPKGDRPAGIAHAWQALTRDAGWAGVLAESFLADPKRPAILLFRPGIELLPLFVEAIALLPPARRWDVEFSTYFTTLPQGLNCPWRGVLEGSSEAESLLRLPNALVINLGRPSERRAEGRALVEQARTGVCPEPPRAQVAASNAGQPGTGKSSPPGRRVSGAAEAPITGAAAGNEPFVPPAAPRPPRRPPASGRRPPARRNAGRNWSIAAGIVTLCVAGLATTAYFLFPRTGADTTAELKRDPQVAKSRPTPVRDPIPTDLNSTPVAQTDPKAEAPKPTPNATDPTKGIDPTTEPRGQLAAVTQPQDKKEDEGTTARDKSETKKVAAAPPKNKSPITGDPADPEPETKTVSTEPKSSVNRSTVLKSDLKEPANGDFGPGASAPVELKFKPVIEDGTRITKLALSMTSPGKDRVSGADSNVPRQTLKSDSPDHATLRVTVDLGGPISAINQPVARFTATGGKIAFDWDDYGRKADSKPTRDLLRNCLLEITTEKSVLYALLTKAPAENRNSLKIPPGDQDKIRTSLSKKKPITRPVPWVNGAKKQYGSLTNTLIILRLEAALAESKTGLKFEKDETEGEWRLDGPEGSYLKVNIDENAQIGFRFVSVPDENRPRVSGGRRSRPRTVDSAGDRADGLSGKSTSEGHQTAPESGRAVAPELDKLLGAGYSMILGWKIGGQEVEFYRRGSFEKE